MNTGFLGPTVATVLTVYGIETYKLSYSDNHFRSVATVLTVYGIETTSTNYTIQHKSCNSTYRLRY